MATKQTLTIDKQMLVAKNSNYKCGFCGNDCTNFFDASVTIEHIENWLKDRKDVKYLTLACQVCNSKAGNKAKTYDAQSLIDNNQTEISDDELFQVFKLIANYNENYMLNFTTRERERSKGNFKVSGMYVIKEKYVIMIQKAIAENRADKFLAERKAENEKMLAIVEENKRQMLEYLKAN